MDAELLEMEQMALQKGNVVPLTRELEKNGLLDLDMFAWPHEVAAQQFLLAYKNYFGNKK